MSRPMPCLQLFGLLGRETSHSGSAPEEKSHSRQPAMGCVGSVNVDHPASAAHIQKTRSNGLGHSCLLVGIKDQNMTGKVYISGVAASDPQLLASVDAAVKKTNDGVARGSDEHDKLWDIAWHNTRMTSGYQMLSLKKPFFPIGRHASCSCKPCKLCLDVNMS